MNADPKCLQREDALLGQYPGATIEALERRADLREVHRSGRPPADYVAVFRIEPQGR